jgi:exosortase/archaeosortase family protein
LSVTYNSAFRQASARWFARPSPSDLAICGRLLACLVVILLDYACVPALFNSSTLWAAATLLILVFRRGQSATASFEKPDLTSLAKWQIAVFVGLQFAIIVLGRRFSADLSSTGPSDSAGAAMLGAAKLLVLLPGLVLFSVSDWGRLARRYRAEILAAVVVLFTFFPYRLMHTLWPVYSEWIAKLTYDGAKPFVAGIRLVNERLPTIYGPRLALAIGFECAGFSALAAFDTLIALIAVVDWNSLSPKRLLITYCVGCVTILAANIVRMSLLVVAGNLIGPQYATGRFHVNAGWVFFAIVYFAIFSVSYRWMLRGSERLPTRL